GHRSGARNADWIGGLINDRFPSWPCCHQPRPDGPRAGCVRYAAAMTEDQAAIEDKTVFREGVIVNCTGDTPSRRREQRSADLKPSSANRKPVSQSSHRLPQTSYVLLNGPYCLPPARNLR